MKENEDEPEGPCTLCGYNADPNDPEIVEFWLQCKLCNNWYHESCVEETGILDDLYFSLYMQSLLLDYDVKS